MDLEGCYVDPTKEDKKQKEAYDELFDDDETDEKKENIKGPAPLHPDDEALINWKGSVGDSAAKELKRRRDVARAEARKGSGTNLTTGPQQQISLAKRKEGFQTRVLDEQNPFFMKKTTYLANDPTQSVHMFKSLAETKAKAAIEVEKQLQSNKLSDKDTAIKSFEIANKASTKRAHPTKKNVEAMEEISLLPDDITWGYTFTHVVLDNLPKMDSKRELTSKQLESAYIADVSKGTNLRMECNLLVTDDDDSSTLKGMYNAVQRYDLDVVPLKEVNTPHSNFLFVVDEENNVAHYHPVSSRVQLSTGRPAYSDAGTRSILKRKLEAVEVTDLEKTLAEVDADMAKKHGIEEDNADAHNSVPRQNPFSNVDSSDESDEGF
jgi:RNA polymerase II-associated factor 1